MEREPSGDLLIQQEKAKVLKAWGNLTESGAVVLLKGIYEQELEEIGGAELLTFIDTVNPARLQQYLHAHPESSPLFVRQAHFQKRPERTAAVCEVTFNHREIINLQSKKRTDFFDGIAAEADEEGAITVFQFQNRADGMHVPMDITYRSEDKDVLAQRVKEEIERCYRMAKRTPQPRKRR